jgi:hypothetical protein
MAAIIASRNIGGYGFLARWATAHSVGAEAIRSTSSGVTIAVIGPPYSPTPPPVTLSKTLPVVEPGSTPPACWAPADR